MSSADDFSIEDLDDEFEWIESEMVDAPKPVKKNKSNIQDLDLYRFIASIQQTEYSFYTSHNDSVNLPFISEQLLANLTFARGIADELDYNLNNLTHIYYFNIMLRQISYISSAGIRTGVKIDDLANEEGFINKIKDINIDGVVLLEDEFSSNEVSMHIKSVLVPYSIYFDYTISSHFSNVSLSTYLATVIDIAKNVATKWNRDLNINKRHLLFTSVLDTVARFTLENMYQYIASELESKVDGIDYLNVTIWDSIDEYDLGLSDYPTEMNRLLDKVESLITTAIADFYVKHITLKNLVSKERARLYLISKTSECWMSFHDSVIAEIKALDISDRQQYFKKNNKTPPLAPFYKELKEGLVKFTEELQQIDFKHDEFVLGTKQKFSTLWGASNAYCNAKR